MARSFSGSSTISAALVTQAQQGHPEPLAAAIRERLFRSLCRSVPEPIAEDLAQDRVLPLLDAFCKDAVAPGCWDAYTHRTAVRQIISHRSRNHEVLLEDADTVEADAPTFEQRLLDAEQKAAIHAALDVLPSADRDLLWRHYFLDIPLSGLFPGVPMPAVYKRHERAKQRLREVLVRRAG